MKQCFHPLSDCITVYQPARMNAITLGSKTITRTAGRKKIIAITLSRLGRAFSQVIYAWRWRLRAARSCSSMAGPNATPAARARCTAPANTATSFAPQEPAQSSSALSADMPACILAATRRSCRATPSPRQ